MVAISPARSSSKGGGITNPFFMILSALLSCGSKSSASKVAAVLACSSDPRMPLLLKSAATFCES